MGNYTFVVENNINLVDYEGFVEFIKSKDDVLFFVLDEHKENYQKLKQDCFDCFRSLLKELPSSHDDWDSLFSDYIYNLFDARKILGYWYAGFCYFLRELAQFVEGDITLVEDRDYCKLKFIDAQILFSSGGVVFGEQESFDSAVGIKPLPQRIASIRRL